MTRRVVNFTRCKPFIRHDAWPYVKKLDDGTWMWSDAPDFHYPKGYMKDGVKCPYGQVGDRLWMRETCQYPINRDGSPVKSAIYKADISDSDLKNESCDWNWKPSIFMPRWASRIILDITNIRVERLQEITNDDAVKEGMTRKLASFLGLSVSPSEEEFNLTQARRTFIAFWDYLNAKSGHPWSQNEWVWPIEFKKLVS
jgi:hypothetical protein